MNVAYDLWLHDIANPDWQDKPTDEVMVWLYRGRRRPGRHQAGDRDDRRHDLGPVPGQHRLERVLVRAYRATPTSADLNLTDFTDDLVARGWLAKTKYLSSVQAGTEIFTGAGRLDTQAYSVRSADPGARPSPTAGAAGLAYRRSE